MLWTPLFEKAFISEYPCLSSWTEGFPPTTASDRLKIPPKGLESDNHINLRHGSFNIRWQRSFPIAADWGSASSESLLTDRPFLVIRIRMMMMTMMIMTMLIMVALMMTMPMRIKQMVVVLWSEELPADGSWSVNDALSTACPTTFISPTIFRILILIYWHWSPNSNNCISTYKYKGGHQNINRDACPNP